MAKPFAVFDIDGTLIRWQLYHALADALVRQGAIDTDAFQAIRQARMNWKTRSHETSFRDYEQSLFTLVDQSISSVHVEDFSVACRQVINEYKDQVYTYTRDLIIELKQKGYLLFAISGSQAEIVGQLADYYEFDDFGGSRYEIRDGMYTGKKDLLISEQKPVYLAELVEKHGATWQGSIAVGDSESDIPLLAKVQQPIAFNPTKQLFEHAQSQRWRIVVERKNVIYKLDTNGDEYTLQ